MTMKRTIMTTLGLFFVGIILSGSGRAQAQEEPPATSASGDARFVHSTEQGPSQAFNRRWDGKRYDVGEFDLDLHTGLEKALLDLDLGDLRSTTERGALDFSWGSAVNLKGDFDRLVHREDFLLNGMVINNQWTPNTQASSPITFNAPGTGNVLKRDFQEESLNLSLPDHPEYRLFGGEWLQHQYGDRALTIDNVVYSQGVSNYTQQINAGVDADIIDKGQLYYEYVFRKFENNAPTFTGKNGFWPANDMTANKIAFRYNPSSSLSLAGGALERQRYSQFNGLTQYTYAGNLSAAYRPTKDLSLSARLYDRSVQNNPNAGFPGTSPGTAIDFLFLKGDFDARYTGIHNAVLNASYRPELTQRRNANQWAELFTDASNIVYQNVTIAANNTQANAAASQDTRHNLQGRITLQLPKDVELEFGEKYLIANAAAYENTPTLSNEPSVNITVPLPQRLIWTGNFTDSRSENQRCTMTNFKSTKDTFMTGMTWSEAKGRGSVGFFYTFEEGTDTINAWFGLSNSAQYYSAPNKNSFYTVSPLINAPAAPYNYKNHVLSVSATARPVEKLRLMGDVSYTDSEGTFLTSQVFDPYFTGAPGSTVQAFNPTDLRILRYGAHVNYELAKYVSARAGFRQSSWIDRIDSSNDGRESVYDLGVSAKF